MKKRYIFYAIGLVVLLSVLYWLEKGRNPPDEPSIPPGAKPGDVIVNSQTGETNIVVDVTTEEDGEKKETLALAPTGGRTLERRPLEPEATERLHDGPVVVKTLFEASGHAEHGKKGLLTKGAYYYMTVVKARSEIVEKEPGDVLIRVVEKRQFLQAQDVLSLSDTDVVLDLSTLPVDTVQTWANHACTLGGALAAYVGRPDVALGFAGVHLAFEAAFTALASVDGRSVRGFERSVRGLLGDFGIEPPENMSAWLEHRLTNLVSKTSVVHSALQFIQGKTYIITYTQDAVGRPLKVDFQHEKGEPITDAEWEILRMANVFLDQNLVPDARCEVGDRWPVWVDEIQEFFGLGTAGKSEGTIWFVREEDQPDGNWTLRVDPTEITYRGADGRGTLAVSNAVGLVDANSMSVKTLQIIATGDMEMLSKKRHWLFFDFIQKNKGNANMRFTLSAEPAGD